MKSLYSTGKLLISLIAALLIFTVFGGIAAGESAESGVAIKKYDTVAYFKAGKALKGQESFTFEWHNLTWYFLSEENRDLFANNPRNTPLNMTAFVPGP